MDRSQIEQTSTPFSSRFIRAVLSRLRRLAGDKSEKVTLELAGSSPSLGLPERTGLGWSLVAAMLNFSGVFFGATLV